MQSARIGVDIGFTDITKKILDVVVMIVLLRSVIANISLLQQF